MNVFKFTIVKNFRLIAQSDRQDTTMALKKSWICLVHLVKGQSHPCKVEYKPCPYSFHNQDRSMNHLISLCEAVMKRTAVLLLNILK